MTAVASITPDAKRPKKEHYYMCSCRLEKNYFLADIKMYFDYNGDDSKFIDKYAGSLPADGPSIEEVLDEVRNQHAARVALPHASAARAERIAKEYNRLHPEVYTMNETSFLTPGFLELASVMQSYGNSPSETVKCIDDLKARNLLIPIRDGIWTFEVFTERFCNLLEAEFQHFYDSGLEKSNPNTMNKYGLIMGELGMCTGLLDPLIYKYIDSIASRLLPPAITKGLDSYRAFTVLYDVDKDGDRELAKHYDNSEVTLNVNIGGSWEGGSVTFFGLATAEQTPDLKVEVELRRGHGIIHAGLDYHQSIAITSGRRHNLIIWCRSSAVRNKICHLCSSVPTVVPTNEYAHEGFTVPPCRLVGASAL